MKTRKIKSYPVEIYRTFIFKRFRFEWRWRVKATNGNIIGGATEFYVKRSDLIYNIKSLGKSLMDFKDE